MTTAGPVGRRNVLAACGLAAPLVFTAAVIAASINHPGYEQLKNPISELGATGAPAAGVMNFAGFLPYGLMMVAFALAVHRGIRADAGGWLGPSILALYGLAQTAHMSNGRLDVLRRAAHDEPFYWGLDVIFSDVEKPRLFRPGARVNGFPAASSIIQGYDLALVRQHPNADFLQQMSNVELSNRLPELLLMRVDKFSMAHSLEARAPFLDHELVSYALSLPQRSKILGAETKRVLKQAVADILPANVINRRKQGFRVPLPAWLAGPLSGWAEERLFSKKARELDFFDFDYIRQLWQLHQSDRLQHLLYGVLRVEPGEEVLAARY